MHVCTDASPWGAWVRHSARPWLHRARQPLLVAALACQMVLCLAFTLPQTVFLADVFQILAALVAILSAGWRYLGARDGGEGRAGRAWFGVGIAFLCWAAGQTFATFSDLGFHSSYLDAASEGCWLFFDFSLLLIASLATPSSPRGWVAWIETGQSCLLMGVLTALMLPIPGIISAAATDELQALTLLLVFALRYCLSERGPDRRFYHGMLLYIAVYTALCVVYHVGLAWRPSLAPQLGMCWSLPTTLLSVLMLLEREPASPSVSRRRPWWETRAAHLEGLVSCGIASMSLCAASVLTLHRPVIGALALALNFAGFTARYTVREWQLRTVQARLGHELVHDPLTGLANRQQLLQHLAELLEGSGGAVRPGVIFLGMDRFKTINEALGPVFGDELLSSVATVLRKLVGERGQLTRYGGDEFVVVMREAGPNGLETLAGELLDGLRKPLEMGGRVLQLTASAGCVVARPGESAREVLTDALSALYQAKSLGRNRALTFDPSMASLAKRRLELEQGLREALLHGRMAVHYQPIYALPGGRLAGFEALARWRDPVRGDISPGEFIPVAESTGTIQMLGIHVLHTACRQLRAWNDRFGSSLFVTVNVSAIELLDPELLDRVIAALRENGLRGEHLKLEVTESALLQGYSHAERTLERARSLGIEVCLDDFGTGYSSLSYLLNLPMDVVKIDRSFVREDGGTEGEGDRAGHNRRRLALLGSVTQLLAALGKRVVIEGIENGAAMQRALDLGCEFVQGFYLSRPLPAEEIPALLSAPPVERKPAKAYSGPAREPLTAMAGMGVPHAGL